MVCVTLNKSKNQKDVWTLFYYRPNDQKLIFHNLFYSTRNNNYKITIVPLMKEQYKPFDYLFSV